MVSLIIYACLIASPAECERFDVPGQVSSFQCAIFGQQQAAEWAKYHSKWSVTRYVCTPLQEA